MQVGSATLHLDQNSGVTIIDLDDDVLHLSLTEGSMTIRVLRKRDSESISIDTPNTTIALLRPGVITVMVGGDAQRIVVFGGFAEISPQGLTVLADYATSLEELDPTMLAARISEIEEKIKQAQPGSVLDRELERLDHFKAVDTHLQTTAMH